MKTKQFPTDEERVEYINTTFSRGKTTLDLIKGILKSPIKINTELYTYIKQCLLEFPFKIVF